jgi:outer membrane protein assembly factor BamE (lipoprotein component of BamABCDE complex)
MTFKLRSIVWPTPHLMTCICLVALFIVQMACSYAKGAPYVVTGRPFPTEKASEVKEGMPEADVRRIFGEPWQVEKRPEGERWRYYVRQEQDENIYLLGAIKIRTDPYVVDDELSIWLVDGRVRSAQYRFIPVQPRLSGKRHGP